MLETRADFCRECVTSCVDRKVDAGSFYAFYFDLPREYKPQDCPALCDPGLHRAMRLTLDFYTGKLHLTWPAGHPMLSRLPANKQYAEQQSDQSHCVTTDYAGAQGSVPARDWDSHLREYPKQHPALPPASMPEPKNSESGDNFQMSRATQKIPRNTPLKLRLCNSIRSKLPGDTDEKPDGCNLKQLFPALMTHIGTNVFGNSVGRWTANDAGTIRASQKWQAMPALTKGRLAGFRPR